MSLPPTDRTFVFIGGLHRSGTTLLARCLSEHQEVSGFTNTEATEDEGQFLQSVYSVASRYGGSGLFGFAPEMHVTEDSPMATDTNRRRLYTEWSRYWNLDRFIFVEKSPPNLLKTRFLQAMFPNTRFVIVLRHPIATSLATQKWSHTSLAGLIRHWLVCNEKMLADLPYLQHVTILRYEDLISRGDDELIRLHEFIGSEPRGCGFEPRTDLNEAYFARWHSLEQQSIGAYYRRRIEQQFETRVNRFGYSLHNPEFLMDREVLLRRMLTGHDRKSCEGAES